MQLELTPEQCSNKNAYWAFARREIEPLAAEMDREQRFSAELIQKIADAGYLGAVISAEYGGAPLDEISFGLLNEAFGAACSSARSLLTVHSMCATAIGRWGSKQLREQWLPQLASGSKIGAFALSEPQAGSDPSGIKMDAVIEGDSVILNGQKKWTTFGRIADVYLLFAKVQDAPIAILVERETGGVSTKPMIDLLGTRGSEVAEIHLDNVRVPKSNMVGGPGFGIAAVALHALNVGRYSVGWGCIGLGQASLDASRAYARERQQFGKPLNQHQLIQQLLTNMYVDLESARWLFYRAGHLRQQRNPEATAATLVAKYAASRMSFKAANDAVQIHGGNGCSPDYPVERYLRDAKIMEIIEGSHQMQQVMIAEQLVN